MYKVDWKKEWPHLLLVAAVIIASVVLYPKFPEIMPSHWNVAGEVDGYMPRLQNVLMLSGLAVGMYFLLLFIPFFDPKRKSYAMFLDSYRMLRLCLLLVISGVIGVVYAASLGVALNVGDLITAGVSLLLIFLGNMMGKFPQNYFVGIRLPWTLADEENWNKTHRFGGKVIVIAGIVTFLSIFLPMMLRLVIFFSAIFAIIIIPAIYSLRLDLEKQSKDKKVS
ncbi:MAG: SdpI family protein [Candidatus Dojkabacteria bacterium]|nr:MAG: SdpI family protein [Candidatus Dojkabacteria bacterium]